MALAEFFDRIGDSAAQVLGTDDREALAARLEECAITIAFDKRVNTTEGSASLDMLVRLLARLFPRLAFQSLDGTTAEWAMELAKAINPRIELGHDAESRALEVVLGGTEGAQESSLYCGAEGWFAKVGTKHPLGFGMSDNPFGAGAAACIVAANVFRWAFSDSLERPDLDDDLNLSMLNFAHGRRGSNRPLPTRRDLGRFALVGLGAIGNAAVWSLGRMQETGGAIDLIDHERIDLGNLQRYVLTERQSVGAEKVELMGRFLPGFEINAHPMRWSQFLQSSGTHAYDLVGVGLDTARDRVLLQGSLPREIVNSWTQRGDLGVSRHMDFADEGACLACLYLDPRPSPHEDELVAKELGLPEKSKDIGHMLHLGAPIGADFMRMLAERNAIPEVDLMPFAHLPLREFRAKAVCGGGLFSAISAKGAIEVPMAFQSALAGILLAAEIVATRLGLRRRSLPTKTTIDLLRPIPRILNFPAQKNVSAKVRCICQDNDYVSVYKRKYAVRG